MLSENYTYQTQSQDNKKLKSDLEESQQHAKQLQRVIYFLRERSEEAHLEAKQLKEEFQITQETIATLSKECEASKAEINDLQNRLLKEQTNRQEAEEEVKSLQFQFENLKNAVTTAKQELISSNQLAQSLQVQYSKLDQTLQEKDHSLLTLENEIAIIKQNFVKGLREMQALEARYQEAIHDKAALANKLHLVQQHVEKQKEDSQVTLQHHANQIEQLNATLSLLHQEKKLLEETVEGRELDTKAAQQHLAKKLKETAILSEKNEEQRSQIIQLQTALADSQSKMYSLQNTFEIQLQHERRLQEQTDDHLKAAELQANKWEGKYFQLQDKYQELEKQNRELKVYEEKQTQAQALLSSLGVVMGISPAPTSPLLAVQNLLDSKTSTKPEETPPANSTKQASDDKLSLFEMPEPFVRYKQTLFD